MRKISRLHYMYFLLELIGEGGVHAESWLVSLLKAIKPISALSIACSISSLSTHWLLKKEAHELDRILISNGFNPDHNTFEELEDMAQSRRFWRSLVVAIEPEDTLELQQLKGRRRGNQGAQGPQHWILTLLNG